MDERAHQPAHYLQGDSCALARCAADFAPDTANRADLHSRGGRGLGARRRPRAGPAAHRIAGRGHAARLVAGRGRIVAIRLDLACPSYAISLVWSSADDRRHHPVLETTL